MRPNPPLPRILHSSAQIGEGGIEMVRRLTLCVAASLAGLMGLSSPVGATVDCTRKLHMADSPTVPVAGELSAVHVSSPTDAWVGGDAGGQALAERWDGAEWATVPAAAPGDASRLFGVTAVSSDDAWAVGSWDVGASDHGLIEHWDGQAWTQFPTTAVNDLNAVDSSPTGGVWAVGVGPYLARWTGTA